MSPLGVLAFDFELRRQPATFARFAEPQNSRSRALVAFANPAAIALNDRASGASAPNGISNPYSSNITAQYLGATVGAGNGGFTNSNSAVLSQVTLVADGGERHGQRSRRFAFEQSDQQCCGDDDRRQRKFARRPHESVWLLPLRRSRNWRDLRLLGERQNLPIRFASANDFC